MEEERTNCSARFKYFLFGGVVGAVTALLFAPKSGKETRDLIATKARDSKDAVQEGAKTVTQKLGESKEQLKKTISNEKDTLSAAYHAGKEAYQEEKATEKEG
ncbi:MAG: YtxH domain-containing protein [Deltaproteobacteria bacterium]|jgi:gas vesicle protein